MNVYILYVLSSTFVGVPVPSAVESKKLQQFPVVREVLRIQMQYRLCLILMSSGHGLSHSIHLLSFRVALCFCLIGSKYEQFQLFSSCYKSFESIAMNFAQFRHQIFLKFEND